LSYFSRSHFDERPYEVLKEVNQFQVFLVEIRILKIRFSVRWITAEPNAAVADALIAGKKTKERVLFCDT
jgi:hypothetical protein